MKFVSAVVCDEIRTEGNGKDILIGCYNDVILIPTVPAVMRTLFFRVLFQSEKVGTFPISMELRDPKGKPVLGMSGESEVRKASEPFGINFGGGPIVLESFGTYELTMVEKKEPSQSLATTIFKFVVRPPEFEAEKERMQSATVSV